ncbi:hypothetical protein Rhow_004631 [Rhodococcus wratislaviensis]|uniref:Uncharacterized protein n=1 Tax=Rhodococcus wratislaviensis TaxID=44752 RepID=A0A402CBL8_RHOWR|nr:hypothetical protein [Rhodococcus wratislaviensis]GCE40988.1 hypothetical protein Rhow_004631 [Rhodococcus wratislaviensis]
MAMRDPNIAKRPDMIALLLLGVLVVWKFGSFFARFVGLLTIVGAAMAMMVEPVSALPANFLTLATGIIIWLAGHWLWAYRHKTWRTRRALSAFSRTGLHHLAPIPTNYRPKPHATQWPSRRGLSR